MTDNSPLTPKEWERLNWCLEVLDEDNLIECRDEAEVFAYQEVHASEAYFDLLPLLVKLRVRELEEQRERGRDCDGE